MNSPFRAFVNPARQQLDLICGELVVGFGRGHVVIWVSRSDAPDQFAFGAFAGNNDRLAVADAKRAFFSVESQFGFARLFVGAMAWEESRG
jgi:hypothetical protein